MEPAKHEKEAEKEIEEKRVSYAEWMTTLFKKFSREMEYIERNTTDHERAQMSRADVTEPPYDQMTLEEIYDEVWKLENDPNEKGDNKVERMTKEDWKRLSSNGEQMKNKRTGIYAQVTEEYTQEEYDQWRQSIKLPEKPIQTENAELREWIRVMFELSRDCLLYTSRCV